MSLNVSSWFLAQAASRLSAPRRYFSLAGSDHSGAVLRWPTLQYRADTINLGTTSITLGNIGQGLRSLVDSPVLLTTSCEIALGFTHPDSGEERISLYMGQPAHVEFADNGTRVRIQLQGKTRALTDLMVGTAQESGGVNYTSSAHYPADLAWYLVTSHGGMSAVTSTSNPDLDYAQWQAWRELNVVRDDRVLAYLTGDKIYSVLNDLAYMNSMVITFQDAKLRMQPVFDAYSADTFGIDPDAVIEASLGMDPTRILNRFDVDVDYNLGIRRFLSGISKVQSASQARYGPRAGRFGKTNVWFDSAGDGRYLAEDVLRLYREPLPRVSLSTTLAGGIHRAVGDVVTLTDSFLGIDPAPYRLLEMRIDLDQARLEFELEPALRRPWQFEGSVSSYNALPRSIVEVASGAFLALDEENFGKRVLRTDDQGYLRALNLYATAMLPLNATEVLLGGPPSSSSLQSVLQRSSDAGSSATIVHTLNSNIRGVYDIFQVRSGTALASTHSGGILRSTDAGSSWSTTWTISGHYYVSRFCAPSSGRIWGATGYHNTLAEGLYLWESTDEGVNWTRKHVVVASGGGRFIANGFLRLTDSEHLLASNDTSASGLRVFRSRWQSVNSIAWIVVNSEISFSHAIATDSGDLLAGFDQINTLNGGAIYRSLDQGSSWIEDARIAKQGNIRLFDRGGGVADAFLARTTAGPRTDRYRNHDITERN